MKRKVRKYVEGGYGDVSSEDYGMGSREEMIERNIEENERRSQMAESSPVRSPEIIRATTVEEFAEPGTAGFSRTALKSAAKPAAKPSPKSATKPTSQTAKPMGRTAMGKTAEQEMAAIEAGKKAAGKADLERRMAYDKPLERVTPEANLIGGPGLRALRSAGAGLASKIAPQAAKPRVEPKIPQEAANAFPKKPDPPRGGGKDPNARRPTRDELDEMRMGSDYMRKGGKVGSASRRADGIASRGKTRGRYI